MIHSSKTAYVAIADHRDSHGAFSAGDIVIVDEPALLPVLFAEGSLDPDVVVDASVFLGEPETAQQKSAAGSPSASHDRMTRAPGGRRGAAGKFAAKPAGTDGQAAGEASGEA